MRNIGVGIIGAGGMGRTHASAYNSLPQVQIVAVCDILEESARSLAERYGAQWYTNTEEMVRRTDIQAVSICTPDADHLVPSLIAAAAGKHILLEKPLATTLEDAQAIIAAAAKAGVLLMVGHVLRFDPRYCRIKSAIEVGDIGEVMTVYARRAAGRGTQQRLAGKVSLPFYLGVHDYDIMRWYVGSRVVRVTAESRFAASPGQGDVEDACCALLRFENGVLGVVELGWILPDGIASGDWRLDVVGTKGCINWSTDSNFTQSDQQRTVSLDPTMMSVVHGKVAGSFANEIGHFVQCVEQGKQPDITPEDALWAVKIALAVRQSSKTGQPVEMG